jgi:hypothetical protein
MYANYPDRPQQPVALEVWNVMQPVCGKGEKWGEFWAFGWLEYAEPLPLDVVHHWSLLPDDKIEWANLQFYKEGPDGENIKADFLSHTVEELREFIPGNLTEAAIILKGDGV